MKLRSILALATGLSLLVSVSTALAANAPPVVNTFDVPDTSTSPIPVITFTASDSNGTVVGYMITDTSTKPAASDTRWTATAWTQYVTTKIGTLTLYAWAKDNANGISTSKSDTVTVPDPTQARLAALEAQVAALQSLLAHLSRNGNDLYIAGANLHIVNGSGISYGPVNGLGNLIVGYNESRGDGTDNRQGSHNIVAGTQNNYSSYGGLVLGQWNEISGICATVSAGANNTASGNSASVSGGGGNQALEHGSSVSGGQGNIAVGEYASVSGGSSNSAAGASSSVCGGYSSTAAGGISSVSGGYQSLTTGYYSSVSGGFENKAEGDYSSVAGGAANSARGVTSSISGGYYQFVFGENDWQAGSLFQDQ